MREAGRAILFPRASHVNTMTESVEAWRGRRPLPHGLVSFPRNVLPWIEPWFLTYACLGVVQGGMLPILLPLSAGGSTHAGAVVGVMNLAGLTAPAWGHLADRRRLHREVLLIGLVATVAPLALMPAELGLPVKLALAAALGAGSAAWPAHSPRIPLRKAKRRTPSA